MADPRARARRLVHLTEDHHGAVQNPRLLHGAVELLRLPAALADAAEQADAPIAPGHVVNDLGDEHGLAHAGAAEQTGLAAALERGQQIDGLDAGFEYVAGGDSLLQGQGLAVEGPLAVGLDVQISIDGLAGDIQHPAQQALAHRHPQGMPRITDGVASPEPAGGSERHRAHGLRVEMGLDLQDHALLGSGPQLTVPGRKPDGKSHVHHVAAHGPNAPDAGGSVVGAIVAQCPIRESGSENRNPPACDVGSRAGLAVCLHPAEENGRRARHRTAGGRCARHDAS